MGEGRQAEQQKKTKEAEIVKVYREVKEKACDTKTKWKG